jgi:hypothetical protein
MERGWLDFFNLGMDSWQAVVTTAMNIRVSQIFKEILEQPSTS